MIKEDQAGWNGYIVAYNAYTSGFLMEPGGLMNQSALFADIVFVMQDEFAKVEEENRQALRQAEKAPKTEGQSIFSNPSQQPNQQIPKARIRRS